MANSYYGLSLATSKASIIYYTLLLSIETHLSNIFTDAKPVISVMGKYVGARPELIKINPADKRVLDSPRNISRYVVIAQTQIKEAYSYGIPKKVFP